MNLSRNGLLAVWAAVLFSACLLLHTRHNDFPFYYHPDEPGKVDQVQTGRWNFNHPMLLLSATRLVVDSLAVRDDTQAVVEKGRLVSAVFTSVAVVAFSLLAFLWRGWAGAWTAGVVLALHHQLYELSHYMKEDTALLMGLALTFLAATMFWQKPGAARGAFLGVACALAISGKFMGVLSLAVAAPVLWRGKSRAALCWFFCALLAVLALVNLPLLANPEIFEKSFGREMGFVVHGQKGMTRSVPHAQYWSIFLDNSTPVIWLLLGVFLFARWHERRAVAPAEWALIVFPFVFALILSCSPKSNDRYFLPASAVLTILAVLGIEDAAHLLSGHLQRRMVLAGAALLLVVLQIIGWAPSREGLLQYEEAFQQDDNVELIGWIRQELPAGAVIAKDNRVRLPNPADKPQVALLRSLPQKVLAANYAADLGTLAELQQKGVTHVIVSESDYGKFFLKNLRPQTSEQASFARRKAFYEQLSREGVLLWESERSTVIYLHPGLRVYRLNPAE